MLFCNQFTPLLWEHCCCVSIAGLPFHGFCMPSQISPIVELSFEGQNSRRHGTSQHWACCYSPDTSPNSDPKFSSFLTNTPHLIFFNQTIIQCNPFCSPFRVWCSFHHFWQRKINLLSGSQPPRFLFVFKSMPCRLEDFDCGLSLPHFNEAFITLIQRTEIPGTNPFVCRLPRSHRCLDRTNVVYLRRGCN